MNSGVENIIPNSFTIYAQSARSKEKAGFFGLMELENFSGVAVEPYINAKIDATSEITLILDLSSIKAWDVTALLWFVVALHHYKHKKGLSFRLRLPQGASGMSGSDKDDYDRSADYLRRWRFDRGLRHIDGDIDNLLVPEQKGYFDPPEPRKFYLDRKVINKSGILESFISRRLAEIRNVSDPTFSGANPISPDRISQCVREFQADRIGDILNVQCHIEKRKADLFSDHLITESLLNIQEHPEATIGLISISILGKAKKLVLSVVDNGKSIASTIFNRYLQDKGELIGLDGKPVLDYDRNNLSREQKADIIHFATKEGVSSKPVSTTKNIGMGLTYIKEDTVNIFKGKLSIITDEVRLRYNNTDSVDSFDWNHSWEGNLLRIAIPIDSLDKDI